jgi:hypothetical protein
LTIARAERSKQIQKAFVLHLTFTELNKVNDSLLGNLLIEQDLIVLQKLSNG